MTVQLLRMHACNRRARMQPPAQPHATAVCWDMGRMQPPFLQAWAHATAHACAYETAARTRGDDDQLSALERALQLSIAGVGGDLGG